MAPSITAYRWWLNRSRLHRPRVALTSTGDGRSGRNAMQRDKSALNAHDIARLLARSINSLVADLLPAGKREGHEWFVGSIAGEAGHSLGIHLTGAKAGVWSDFATGDRGDALDLVRAVLDV